MKNSKEKLANISKSRSLSRQVSEQMNVFFFYFLSNGKMTKMANPGPLAHFWWHTDKFGFNYSTHIWEMVISFPNDFQIAFETIDFFCVCAHFLSLTLNTNVKVVEFCQICVRMHANANACHTHTHTHTFPY